MKKQLLKINELKKYEDYIWTEISIGCSDTNVFKLSKNKETVFLKAGKSGLLTKEYLNLKKLNKYLNVPQVLFYYNDCIEVLLTTEMTGKMSCDDECIDVYPKETLGVLCDAIKILQSIPIDEKLTKEFKVYDLEEDIKEIKKRSAVGDLCEVPDKKVFEKFSDLSEVVEYLGNNKPEGELYLSHGDVSMPNVFIEGNKLAGFIDVGNAGIRQKWYDITDLYISIRRNFESQDIADEFLRKIDVENKEFIYYYEILISLL